MTRFDEIYDRFYGKITDDMYDQWEDDPTAWTRADTEADVFNIMMDAIPGFEFPRFPLYGFSKHAETVTELDKDGYPRQVTIEYYQYDTDLTSEEINIFALLMYNAWLQRQIASIENTRMKFSGSDYKLSSQANHLAKLIELKKEAERQAHHMQRLYKRRKLVDDKGSIESNWSILRESSALSG